MFKVIQKLARSPPTGLYSPVAPLKLIKVSQRQVN